MSTHLHSELVKEICEDEKSKNVNFTRGEFMASLTMNLEENLVLLLM